MTDVDAAVVRPAGEHEAALAALTDLREGVAVWAATGLRARRELLTQLRALTEQHATDWVRAAAGIKALPEGSPLTGEEWMSGPYALLGELNALEETARALEAGRSPVDGFRTGRTAGGQVTVRVLPHGLHEHLLLSGYRADVWIRPGQSLEQVRERAGLGLLSPAETHGVGVVLGAGNITSIAPLDVLNELYADNRVVALKLNPVTDPLLPVLEKIFAPLIDLGVVRILTGGADVGGLLVHSDLVDHVHLTGSAITHDAVVWGRGEEAARRKAASDPLLTKEITSELGGVSPTIVVPGRWSRADLKFQAEHVATQRLHNGGYNCIASQVLVVAADWPQKDAFLAELRSAIGRAPARAGYYPGSDRRMAEAVAACPATSEWIGDRVLITADTPEERAYLLNTEFFAPVYGIVELPGGDPAQFLDDAVRSANEDFCGTLGVNLIAHPRTLKDLGPKFEQAVADLRYGSIAVNAWTGVGFLTPRGSWGAFPGHTVDDVQSGIGVVHNGVLLADPERTVLRGPFRPFPRSVVHGELTLSPKPPWFVTNRTGSLTGERLTRWAARPGWGRVVKVAVSGLRG